MNSVLLATLAGVCTLVLWGVSDWLTSKSSKAHSNHDTNLAIQLMGALIAVIILLVYGKGLPNLHDGIVLLVAAAFFTIAYICFIKGLSIGDVGVIVPLGNTWPFVTLLLTAIFLTLNFTSLQIFAMCVIIAGAVLLGMEKLSWRKLHKNFSKEAPYGVIAALLWGIGFVMVNAVLPKYPWQTTMSTISLAMGAYTVILVLVRSKQGIGRALNRLAANRIGMLAGISLTFGAIAFYIGAEKSGNVLIPAAIAAGAPLATSILAAIFDKEVIILAKRLGAVLVVVGVVLLNLQK